MATITHSDVRRGTASPGFVAVLRDLLVCALAASSSTTDLAEAGVLTTAQAQERAQRQRRHGMR